ncbi:MAG: sodium:proton exchanger [Solirubrobacteraceae bacterium]
MTRFERVGLGAVLTLVVCAGIARYATGVPDVAAFSLAALALAGQAWVVSQATEQVGMRHGPAVTGLLQSTVGNLPEFFVVIFALQAHDTTVAETALIGSVLANALLVLGLVLVAGSVGAPGGLMRFNARLPKDAATLLLVASITIVLIAVVAHAHGGAVPHVEAISLVGAVALLAAYAVWMRQYLRSERSVAAAGESRRLGLSMPMAVGLLVLAGGGSALVSDWFIHALTPAIHTLHLSRTFAGIVIVAIAGNAVENVAGIYLARRGHHDLAIAVVKNSVVQIAAFLYPLLVLISLLTASRLTLSIPSVWAAALIGTAILVWQITGDGEGTVFEGVALIAVYLVVAAIAAF